jgi:hypothetical protein
MCEYYRLNLSAGGVRLAVDISIKKGKVIGSFCLHGDMQLGYCSGDIARQGSSGSKGEITNESNVERGMCVPMPSSILV